MRDEDYEAITTVPEQGYTSMDCLLGSHAVAFENISRSEPISGEETHHH